METFFSILTGVRQTRLKNQRTNWWPMIFDQRLDRELMASVTDLAQNHLFRTTLQQFNFFYLMAFPGIGQYVNTNPCDWKSFQSSTMDDKDQTLFEAPAEADLELFEDDFLHLVLVDDYLPDQNHDTSSSTNVRVRVTAENVCGSRQSSSLWCVATCANQLPNVRSRVAIATQSLPTASWASEKSSKFVTRLMPATDPVHIGSLLLYPNFLEEIGTCSNNLMDRMAFPLSLLDLWNSPATRWRKFNNI